MGKVAHISVKVKKNSDGEEKQCVPRLVWSKMTTFEEVVPEVVEYLTKRHFQLEFRVSHAFFRHPAREEAEVSDYASSDADSESGSIDSENQQFLMAEDAVMANLAGYIRQGRSLAPELEIHLVRNKNTAYLNGWMYATASISKLASVSKAWMQICWKQVTNKHNMSPARLYEASVLWGLKTRAISNSEDELLAKFSGRISRNLRWNKMVHPLADRNASEAASSSDQQP